MIRETGVKGDGGQTPVSFVFLCVASGDEVLPLSPESFANVAWQATHFFGKEDILASKERVDWGVPGS